MVRGGSGELLADTKLLLLREIWPFGFGSLRRANPGVDLPKYLQFLVNEI